MKKLKTIWSFICRIKALKYVLVSAIAIALIGFVDENSVWHHYQNKQKIGELESEIAKYLDQHQRNNARIKLLDSNPKEIEKIARERYFMKADGEDIFMLSDDQENAMADETVE
ncbi:MAG: septum formation initiator family protein [Prevotella sp.]|nr:septum formation initiator family protein [Prevotella sp.]MBR3078385.1 septum formation initiator family protein [Prevotella sp.]